jgi:hypothetical protein
MVTYMFFWLVRLQNKTNQGRECKFKDIYLVRSMEIRDSGWHSSKALLIFILATEVTGQLHASANLTRGKKPSLSTG